MDAFYRLATIDYQLLAEQLDWGKVFHELNQRFGPEVRLLDVACGSGQFPAALLKYGGLETCQNLRVKYSLLDPSEFSIRTACQQLVAPFEPSEENLCTIQQFEPTGSRYAVVWATHALYCVPQRELELAVDRMLAALDTGGLGFIAHASQQSHYVRFHDLYLQNLRSDHAEPFSTGEQVIEVLQAKVDTAALRCWSIDYQGTLDLNDRETAERYLKRCLFDDTVSLDGMLADQQMGDYLRNCIDDTSGMWRFPQRTWLIFFGELAKSIGDHRRR
jgi:SAM-dependent methyltransferase